MPRYTSESKEQVREAVDFVDVVSAKTDLKPSSNSEFLGLCPFHDERTPSFHVNATEKVYYCFGCQAAGDLYTFVMQTESLDFTAALETLATRYGVELKQEKESSSDRKRRESWDRLYQLLDRATGYYSKLLTSSNEGSQALTYLRERGLSDETISTYRLGYSPNEWDRLTSAAKKQGFNEDELQRTGLAQRSEKSRRVYDRFRGRIMFPLADRRGRTIGFGARSLTDDQQPKYLNSPEGSVYHKGSQLYGMDVARSEASKAGETLLVEGYMDVLALHQAGFKNAVGIMGTALTGDQVAELARMAPKVKLMLDADTAGKEAMLKAADVAAKRKIVLEVVPLPLGSDPADVLQSEGVEELNRRVQSAQPFLSFRVDYVLDATDVSNSTDRDRALQELKSVFAAVPPSVLREELVRKVADKLALSEQLTASLVRSKRWVRDAEVGNSDLSVSLSGSDQVQRSFLALCIALPREGQRALNDVSIDSAFTSDLARRAAVHLKQSLNAPLAGLPDEDQALTSYVAELVVRAGSEPSNPKILLISKLQVEKASLEHKMAMAKAEGSDSLSELAAERQRTVEKLREALT